MVDLSLFRFSHPIEIRFADLDALGHVNNAKYLTYMEMARLMYFRQVIGWMGGRDGSGAILARVECDFATPLLLGDPIRVYVRASRIGQKSFDFEHLIVRETDQSEAARGKGVLVAYDYGKDQSITVPEEWRVKMLGFEPGLQKPGS